MRRPVSRISTLLRRDEGRGAIKRTKIECKGDTGAFRGREIQTLYLHTITNSEWNVEEEKEEEEEGWELMIIKMTESRGGSVLKNLKNLNIVASP
jgi:hypothetical protein